jgi:hypothetical protein
MDGAGPHYTHDATPAKAPATTRKMAVIELTSQTEYAMVLRARRR